MFEVMGSLLVVLVIGTLAFTGTGLMLMREPENNPIGIWIVAGITFVATIIVACKFIPIYKEKRKENKLRQQDLSIQCIITSKDRKGKQKTEFK